MEYAKRVIVQNIGWNLQLGPRRLHRRYSGPLNEG